MTLRPAFRTTHRALGAFAAAALSFGLAAPAHAAGWTQVGADVFPVPLAVERSQGMAWDGQNWYFSWQYGLHKTDLAYNVVARNGSFAPMVSGIPTALASQGFNHIGDIDVANGIVYASLDATRTGYNQPAVALYRASDLGYTGTTWRLAPPHGTRDIASWVAVNAATGLAYGMAYNGATEMAVYNLADFSFVRYIPLARTMEHVQGGKIFGDWMYMAADDASRSVYRAHMTTGEVQTLFTLMQPYQQEVEGLAVTADADGRPLVSVLVINDPNNSNRNLSDPRLNVTLYRYAEANDVPEPGALALGLVGLAALGVVRRRNA